MMNLKIRTPKNIIKFFRSFDKSLKTCVFCGRHRWRMNEIDPLWKSSIFRINTWSGELMEIGSVCPICRSNHTIHDLFVILAKQMMELWEKELKKEKK